MGTDQYQFDCRPPRSEHGRSSASTLGWLQSRVGVQDQTVCSHSCRRWTSHRRNRRNWRRSILLQQEVDVWLCIKNYHAVWTFIEQWRCGRSAWRGDGLIENSLGVSLSIGRFQGHGQTAADKHVAASGVTCWIFTITFFLHVWVPCDNNNNFLCWRGFWFLQRIAVPIGSIQHWRRPDVCWGAITLLSTVAVSTGSIWHDRYDTATVREYWNSCSVLNNIVKLSSLSLHYGR